MYSKIKNVHVNVSCNLVERILESLSLSLSSWDRRKSMQHVPKEVLTPWADSQAPW